MVSPPRKGCADWELDGWEGGSLRIEEVVRGLSRAFRRDSSVVGMANGGLWVGIVKGRGRSFSGFGRTFRGASRKGSTLLR